MAKMVKLDWASMKYYRKQMFIILPWIIISFGLMGEELLIPILGFCMMCYSVNPFAVEEKGMLNHLYLTLPVTRKAIVRARYGLALIMQFIGIAAGIVITIAASALLHGRVILSFSHTFEVNFTNVFFIVCLTLLIYSVMNLATFPVLFKLGYAKGKAWGYYVPVMGVFMLGYVFAVLITYSGSFAVWVSSALEWTFIHPAAAAAVMLGLSSLIVMLSYVLSCRIYGKREF